MKKIIVCMVLLCMGVRAAHAVTAQTGCATGFVQESMPYLFLPESESCPSDYVDLGTSSPLSCINRRSTDTGLMCVFFGDTALARWTHASQDSSFSDSTGTFTFTHFCTE